MSGGNRGVAVVLALVLLAALLYLYQTVLFRMVQEWMHDENSSHGFLIPAISGYLAWIRREELARAPVRSCFWGLPVILFGLSLLCAGHFATEYFTQRASFVVVLTGMTLYFGGTAIFRLLWVPLAYLLFMIPIPAVIMDTIAFPLKLFVTKISVMLLHGLGVMVLREGNVMLFPNITLEVVNACSGLRSIVSMFAIGTAMALLLEPRLSNRIILVLLALPVSIVTNIGRVVITGLLARHIGAAAAEGFFHEFAGLAVFGMALAIYFLAWRMLRRVHP
ncbi:exosortase [Megalodesulfovibrio paquesii]